MNSSLPTVAQVLRAAACYINEHGLYVPMQWVNGQRVRSYHPRDNYGPRSNCGNGKRSATDVGAITWAIYRQPIQMPVEKPTPKYVLYRHTLIAYVDYMEKATPYREPATQHGLVFAMRKAAFLWGRKQKAGGAR